ncbi:MAG TPA: SDR family NAD(P)-dependent oxidoreductase, partial [Candidatus Methylomirabilis sp.]|nr:SDR family NAD(P)-dependent oxidoreductase [Candidatus Methylomirabilis sp.]
MNSRWDDAAARDLSDLDLLVYASRLIGAETSLVVWGGGNTSIKCVERDHRGREVRVLRVKGSGSDLKSIQRKDFPGVLMDDILALLERDRMEDQAMVDYFARALLDPASPRPSIETPLHGFLPAAAVLHTHADAIVSLTNNDRCGDVLRQVYDDEVVALPYLRPGFPIARQVAQAFEAHPGARAILLEKHGTICWGAGVKEAYLSTIELISRAEEAIAHRAKGRARFGGVEIASPSPAERRRVAVAVAPVLRGLLSRDRRVVMTFDDSPDVLEFAASKEASALCAVGPATPDHTLYTKRLPCFVPVAQPGDPEAVKAAIPAAVNRFVTDYTAYFDAHNTEGAKLTDPFPRVIVVAGLGVFTAGKDRRTAGIVSDIYHHTVSVVGAASSFGRYVSLSPRDAFDVEYWPLELYKLTREPPEKELARRIALVTGAASGIGRAAALRLAAEGAHVVVTDLDAAGARKVADEVTAMAGGGRAIGIGMDVTAESSVRAALEETVLGYG